MKKGSEAMAEHIDRKAFIEAVKDIPLWGCVAAMFADSIPAADVAPVVHGRWVKNKNSFVIDDYYGYCFDYNCNACGKVVSGGDMLPKYCPNCGARMDGEER